MSTENESTTQFSLIYQGTKDESPDTLRQVKVIFLTELELPVERAQEILQSAPAAIRSGTSLAELEPFRKRLEKAGAKVTIVTPKNEAASTLESAPTTSDADRDSGRVEFSFELGEEDLKPALAETRKRLQRVYKLEIDESEIPEDSPNALQDANQIPSELSPAKLSFSGTTAPAEKPTAWQTAAAQNQDPEPNEPSSVLDLTSAVKDSQAALNELQQLNDTLGEMDNLGLLAEVTKQNKSAFSGGGAPEAAPLSGLSFDEPARGGPELVAKSDPTQAPEPLNVSLAFDEPVTGGQVVEAPAAPVKEGTALTASSLAFDVTEPVKVEEAEYKPIYEQSDPKWESSALNIPPVVEESPKSAAAPLSSTSPSVEKQSRSEPSKAPARQVEEVEIIVEGDSAIANTAPVESAVPATPSKVKRPRGSVLKSILAVLPADILVPTLIALVVMGIGNWMYFGFGAGDSVSVQTVKPPSKAKGGGAQAKSKVGAAKVAESSNPLDDSTDVASSTANEKAKILQFVSRAELNGASFEGVFVTDRSRMFIKSLIGSTPEPPQLTNEQILRKEKRAPWITRFEVQDAIFEQPETGVFHGTGTMRLYLEYNGGRQRIVAPARIRAQLNPDESALVVLVSSSQNWQGDSVAGFAIEPLIDDTFAFSSNLSFTLPVFQEQPSNTERAVVDSVNPPAVDTGGDGASVPPAASPTH